MPTIVYIVVILALIIALPITYKVAINNKAKADAAKIGTAEEKARSMKWTAKSRTEERRFPSRKGVSSLKKMHWTARPTRWKSVKQISQPGTMS